MSTTKVSVIIPIYNTAPTLKRCISSIINQSFKDIEIILINDGSTDNSLSICDSFSAIDKRILVINQHNRGVSSARNKGIDIAKGEWLLFVDSDDFLEPNSIFDLLKIVESANPDVVYFGCKVHESKRVGIRMPPKYKEEYILKNFLLHNQLQPASACLNLFHSEIIYKHNLRFDENLKHNEDGLFVYKYYCHCQKFVLLNLALYNIVTRPDSASNKPITFKVLNDNLNFLSELCDYIRSLGLIESYKEYLNRLLKVFFILVLTSEDFIHNKPYFQNKYRKLIFKNKDIFNSIFSRVGIIRIELVTTAIKTKKLIIKKI